MDTDTITLPAYWASALVNGDYSGLDGDEAARCERAENELAARGWRVVDVTRGEDGEAEESRFTWSYGLYDPDAGVSGGDVLNYTMIRSI